MSDTYYKIRRSGGMDPTTWIGSGPISRLFDPEQMEFIVSEAELGVCLHHGNFKLVGPAPVGEVPPQPVPAPVPEPEVEEEMAAVETFIVKDEEEEETEE